MNEAVKKIVEDLELLPHPEGGFYKESYRAQERFSEQGDFPAQRSHATGIYFLLFDEVYSSFHRIKSDEMWHFYEGGALEVIEITPSGELITTELGRNGVYQYVVKAGHWFASRVKDGNGYALVGCTVSPGFDFQDFELADKGLAELFPRHQGLINSLLVKEI